MGLTPPWALWEPGQSNRWDYPSSCPRHRCDTVSSSWHPCWGPQASSAQTQKPRQLAGRDPGSSPSGPPLGGRQGGLSAPADRPPARGGWAAPRGAHIPVSGCPPVINQADKRLWGYGEWAAPGIPGLLGGLGDTWTASCHLRPWGLVGGVHSRGQGPQPPRAPPPRAPSSKRKMRRNWHASTCQAHAPLMLRPSSLHALPALCAGTAARKVGPFVIINLQARKLRLQGLETGARSQPQEWRRPNGTSFASLGPCPQPAPSPEARDQGAGKSGRRPALPWAADLGGGGSRGGRVGSGRRGGQGPSGVQLQGLSSDWMGDGWVDGWLAGWVNKQVAGWMDGWTDERVDGWVGGWVGRWMGG